MVAHAEINNLSFVYADENKKALQYISFCSKRVSLLHLLEDRDPKTTLLKHFKKELLPIGTRSREIFYEVF